MSWTKLIRFVAEEDGRIYSGDCVTRGDLGLKYARREPILARPLDRESPHPSSSSSGESPPLPPLLTVRTLLSPLSPRSVSSIRGLGLQYAPPSPSSSSSSQAHPPPAVPCLFLKPTSALAGPGDTIPVPLDACAERVDYEVELCVVIGERDCPPNTPATDALEYVKGYTVVNDVTSRGLCTKGGAGQWGIGKNYDG
ncbi:hypothetical protein JCM11491_000882 [Sporobolomyces phaffii]